MVFSCVTVPPPAPREHTRFPQTRPRVTTAGVEAKIHALINHERRNEGLRPLESDAALSRIARGHSRDMFLHAYFSHVSPDGSDFSERYRKARYACAVTIGSTIYEGGENIALNNLYASTRTLNGVVSYDWNSEEEIAQTTVQGWMNSAGHRKNILAPYFRKEGIGVHIGSDDRVYITQNFC